MLATLATIVAQAESAADAFGSPALALVGAVLALSGVAVAPFATHVARRIHPGRQVFFARWGFTHLARVTLGLLVALALVPAVWPLSLDSPLDALLLQSVLIFALPSLLAVHYARKVSPEGARELGLRPDRNGSAVAAGLVAYALLVPGLMGLGLLWPWVVELLDGAYQPQDVLLRFLNELPAARLALAIGLAVLVQPFLEELLFRGFLQPLLVQNFRDKGGVVLTSLAFALPHDTAAFLPVFGLSLLLGGIKLRTQRLSACWAVHALHNGVTIALVLASDEVRAALPPPAWLVP